LALTRSRFTQPLAAGVQTSGRGPSVASFQPFASARMAMPEDLERTMTSAQCPATVRPLYAFAASWTIPNFSGDEAMLSATASEPVHFGACAPSPPVLSLVQILIPMISPAATTMAATKGKIFLLRLAGWELIIEPSPLRCP